MNNLTLRPAGPADSEFAYRVKKAAFREYVEKVWGWDEAEQRRFHEQRFAAQDFRVINVDGEDVGIVALSLSSEALRSASGAERRGMVSPDCLHLNQLFILPEHQGQGIGRACTHLIMEEACQLRLPIRLRVLKVNPRARAFYERMGFVRTGETDTHDLMEFGGCAPQSSGTGEQANRCDGGPHGEVPCQYE